MLAFAVGLAELGRQVMEGSRDPDRPTRVRLPGFADAVPIADSFDQLRHNFRGRYAEHLRETLLVRAVSAFESFLLDAVREIFTVRRDLFHRDEDISLPARFLLGQGSVTSIASHVLSKDLRALSSGGFKRIVGYYKQRFAIDLAACPVSLSAISEVIDRRHLLVHTLGRTDKKYRRDHAVEARRVTVGRTYFAESLEALRQAAAWIDAEGERLVRRPRLGPSATPSLTRITYHVWPRTRRGRASVNLDYVFETEDEIVSLRDLIVSVVNEGDRHSLTLRGSDAQLDAYWRVLLWLKERGDLHGARCEVIRRPKRGPAGIPKTVLEAVETVLGGRTSLPQGMKRRLAEKHGVAAAVVGRAVDYVSFEPSVQELARYEAWLHERRWSADTHISLARQFGIGITRAQKVIHVLSSTPRELRQRAITGGEQPQHDQPSPYSDEV
ncbi:hypothetical protein tb265_49550 [Gemmatimonadetes bacterium T265]|nr:hypothetical protein tb265_49550 [Gemmatimonadetes bacterium T265]